MPNAGIITLNDEQARRRCKLLCCSPTTGVGSIPLWSYTAVAVRSNERQWLIDCVNWGHLATTTPIIACVWVYVRILQNFLDKQGGFIWSTRVSQTPQREVVWLSTDRFGLLRQSEEEVWWFRSTDKSVGVKCSVDVIVGLIRQAWEVTKDCVTISELAMFVCEFSLPCRVAMLIIASDCILQLLHFGSEMAVIGACSSCISDKDFGFDGVR